MTDQLTIRPMIEADVAFGMELKNHAGWNQVEGDWSRYLALEPDGCFVAEWHGEPAGTVTTIDYAGRFGWVGMVLVHPDKRRRGIGSALLLRGIEYLEEKGVRSVKLDATPMGRKVYVRIDFHDEYELRRMEGTAHRFAPSNAASIEPDDLDELCAYDAVAFGADRARALRCLVRDGGGLAFIERDDSGALRGYGLGRPGLNAFHVGPVVAVDGHAARSLFAALFERLDGKRVFLDVPLPNAAAMDLAADLGFTEQRPFTRMYRGSNDYPGTPRSIFATSGAEKG